MDKLDEAIASTAYILDCLRSLRAIYETGDCNNCPFYVKDGEQE